MTHPNQPKRDSLLDALDKLMTGLENEVQLDIISRINGRGNRSPKLTHQIYREKFKALFQQELADLKAQSVLANHNEPTKDGVKGTFEYCVPVSVIDAKIASYKEGME